MFVSFSYKDFIVILKSRIFVDLYLFSENSGTASSRQWIIWCHHQVKVVDLGRQTLSDAVRHVISASDEEQAQFIVINAGTYTEIYRDFKRRRNFWDLGPPGDGGGGGSWYVLGI